MSDKTIDQLTLITSLAGNDEIPIWDTANADTKKALVSQFDTRYAPVLNNLTAAVDPISTNDNTQGYSIGSLWFNTNDSRLWVAQVVTTGSAIWVVVLLGLGRSIITNTAPTALEDQTQGFSVGSFWLDYTTNVLYQCSNPSTGAAVWLPCSPAPNGLISDTYVNIETIVSSNSLIQGTQYLITDRADKGIILTAASANEFEINGNAGYLNADFQNVGIYTGTPQTAGTRQGVWSATNEPGYSQNDIVIWNCLHFQLTNAIARNGTNPLSNPTAYTALAKTTFNVGYIQEWDSIIYDFTNDALIQRSDKLLNSVQENDAFPIENFQWGNNNVYKNIVGGDSNHFGNQALLYCLNQTGVIGGNRVLSKSRVYLSTSAGTVTGNLLDTESVMQANTLGSTAQITDNTLLTTGQIYAEGMTGSIAQMFVQQNFVINMTNSGGNIAVCGCLGDGNAVGSNMPNGGSIYGCVFLNDASLFADSNAGQITNCMFTSNWEVHVSLLVNLRIANCIFSPNQNITLPNNVQYLQKSITPQGSNFSLDVDALANFSAGVLTIPANSQFAGIFNLTTAAGANITGIAGSYNQGMPFRLTCANAITNTIQPTPVGSATANQVVSDAGTFTLVGRTNGGDSADFELRGNLVAKTNSAIMS